MAFLDVARKDLHSTVAGFFPGVMNGSTAMSKLLSAVEPYGLARHNTVFSTSVCPDEINSDPGHLTTLLTGYYGKSFPLGGLGGVPYWGRVGFFAMSHNVPEDGHILVVFGPHIGITPDGELGKVLRRGRSAKSTCGALTTAYDQLTSGGRPRGDRREPYWAWIRDALRPHLAAVRDSSQPMMALVRKFYQIVEDQVLAITTTSYCPGNLVLLGGITINMPHPAPGYFLPLHFSVRSKIMQPKDLMPALQL